VIGTCSEARRGAWDGKVPLGIVQDGVGGEAIDDEIAVEVGTEDLGRHFMAPTIADGIDRDVGRSARSAQRPEPNCCRRVGPQRKGCARGTHAQASSVEPGWLQVGCRKWVETAQRLCILRRDEPLPPSVLCLHFARVP
jgi:hypothetical protein